MSYFSKGSTYVRLYLIVLPYISLFSIILSALRIVENNSYVHTYLLLILFLDLLVVATNTSSLNKRYVVLFFALLIPPLIIGIINYELSRRHITDFVIPFVFFAKLAIFSDYWTRNSFEEYAKYYSKVTLFGSFLLIFFIYSLFSSSGVSRLAIFPPLELTYSYFFVSNNIYFVVSLILIFLYGKRAQLMSAILVLFVGLIFTKGYKRIWSFLVAAVLIFFGGLYVLNNPENISVRRFLYTFEMVDFSDLDSINLASAGRLDEVFAILRHITAIDIFFGKGNGFTYDIILTSGEIKTAANSHFSPLGLYSKYGILFTLSLYAFLFSIFVKSFGIAREDRIVLFCLLAALFIFFESFFAYAIFATAINPVILGYLKGSQRYHDS
ncbi:hypothetical protein DA096_15395 [Vibrio rotiferianus]|uniref:hypothetical protein n=1 Tax=Vibrio rotiferianus TaxID=190895 RepID=UPI0011107B08|nr:hypothetical protein [Vibrio rotiferianus]TMX44380.1 hypothetical protein DA095_00845 [Vibrio rotiferianus]TMX48775.1 hypothetical protein DA093_15915 [Vibrio rotiferianus]TMX62001.1 hypothetical protein DA096_15395 [Vibrio rotiferianus]